jgi:hypothetical protein
LILGQLLIILSAPSQVPFWVLAIVIGHYILFYLLKFSRFLNQVSFDSHWDWNIIQETYKKFSLTPLLLTLGMPKFEPRTRGTNLATYASRLDIVQRSILDS